MRRNSTSTRKRPRLESSSSRDKIRKNIVHDDDSQSENEDDELLELRLMALKTKPEVRDLLDDTETTTKEEEEESLRVQALRSVLNQEKIIELRKKKLMKKIRDNNRPYSPTDQPEVDMILSPLGSPFIEEEIQEVDMEICDSPASSVKETSDMDIAESPPQVSTVSEDSEAVADEEIALRAQLLISLTRKKQEEELLKKKDETKEITENLKLAVQRIKQKKQVPAIPTESSKKFSAVLEKLRSKQVQYQTQEEKKLEEVMMIENKQLQSNVVVTLPQSIEPSTEDIVPEKIIQPEIDPTFSTITDTKNIPIISSKQSEVKSRLVTSLDNVIKPVAKLIISVNMDDSDTDGDEVKIKRNVVRKITKVVKRDNSKKSAFEMKLDSFLKNVRQQQEDLTNTKVADLSKSSAVQHLPLSSQREYQNLVKKMEILEEEKRKQIRLRQLKRTKTSSESPKVADATAMPIPKPLENHSIIEPKETVIQKVELPKEAETLSERISNTLKKINLLDEEAQNRLMFKTEVNYKKHR